MRSRIFVISDLHLHHANMIAGGAIGIRSQFATIEDMNDYIVTKWNHTVTPQDKVYVLGDVTLGRVAEGLSIVASLNGHKRLVLGNHDVQPLQNYIDAGFEKVLGSRELGGLLLTHVPVHPMAIQPRFKGNVHGHTHDKAVTTLRVRKYGNAVLWSEGEQVDARYFNVCVEPLAYTPISLDALIEHFRRIG